MVTVLGYDVGGANTKAALLHTKNGKAAVRVASRYFPIWKAPERLTEVLLSLKQLLGADALDAVGVTMTAELSDAYQTKREGVKHILSCVHETYPNTHTFVLNSDAQLISIDEAENNHLSVSSANWAATGWLLGQQIKNAVIVDVGSTSTSIIPTVNGELAAKGQIRPIQLLSGELVYTGSCAQTSPPSSIQCLSGVVLLGVSSELFANIRRHSPDPWAYLVC